MSPSNKPTQKTIQNISKYANIQPAANWAIVYFNARVQKDVMAMPAGVLADYLRLCDAMTLFGADLRMPHSRALGDGLFELRPKGREGIGRVFLLCATRKNHRGFAFVREKVSRHTRQRNASR